MTEGLPAGTVADLVHRHLALWSTADAAERRRLIPAVYGEQVELFEPDAAVVGHDALDAAISALHAQVGAATFSLDGPVSAHHGLAVYRWLLGPDGGPPAAQGMDVLRLDGERITAAYVFLTEPGR